MKGSRWRLLTVGFFLGAVALMPWGLRGEEDEALTPSLPPEAMEALKETRLLQQLSWWATWGTSWGQAVTPPRLRPKEFSFLLRGVPEEQGEVLLSVLLYEQGYSLHLLVQCWGEGVALRFLGPVGTRRWGVDIVGATLPGSPQSRMVGRDGLVRFRLLPQPEGRRVRLLLETTPAAQVALVEASDTSVLLSFSRPGQVGEEMSVQRVQIGLASWYGEAFAGRRTAGGERFHPDAPTAAHRTLPLGTLVRVVNLENGRSAVVRINDRGPFVRGRIIDVSRGVAQRLGFRSKGLARVRIEVLKKEQ